MVHPLGFPSRRYCSVMKKSTVLDLTQLVEEGVTPHFPHEIIIFFSDYATFTSYIQVECGTTMLIPVSR